MKLVIPHHLGCCTPVCSCIARDTYCCLETGQGDICVNPCKNFRVFSTIMPLCHKRTLRLKSVTQVHSILQGMHGTERKLRSRAVHSCPKVGINILMPSTSSYGTMRTTSGSSKRWQTFPQLQKRLLQERQYQHTDHSIINPFKPAAAESPIFSAQGVPPVSSTFQELNYSALSHIT